MARNCLIIIFIFIVLIVLISLIITKSQKVIGGSDAAHGFAAAAQRLINDKLVAKAFAKAKKKNMLVMFIMKRQKQEKKDAIFKNLYIVQDRPDIFPPGKTIVLSNPMGANYYAWCSTYAQGRYNTDLRSHDIIGVKINNKKILHVSNMEDFINLEKEFPEESSLKYKGLDWYKMFKKYSGISVKYNKNYPETWPYVGKQGFAQSGWYEGISYDRIEIWNEDAIEKIETLT